ncbi:MAG TPA: IS66 family transposase [Dehalococcoidia bacterium]|nr:IS66 family transposase [Dehalococcoidia bacterium]
MTSKGTIDLSGMDRTFFEALTPEARVELLCRLHALAVEQAEKLAQDSTNSSRPPSSDGPFGPTSGTPIGKTPPSSLPLASPPSMAPEPPAPSGRRPGKQRGTKGTWRCEALEAERSENHYPTTCAACGTPFEMWDRQTGHSAHFVLDLERSGSSIRIACVLHRYHAIECACGVRTAARPGIGVLSTVPGRTRDLLLSEACLVGPALATFIAALSGRYHVSRARIREFLAVWFGVPLSVGTLDRCIREVGVACEPVVEDLLGDLRQAGVIHADETPWRQHGRLRWLWVVLSSTTAIFHIGSRQADEIRDLVGDAFLGWLVSDGYGAYRKFTKRQRCLAHLLRKGIALAGGLNPVGVNFGDWLLREVRALIHEVAEGTGARIINPILARLKRACKLHRDDEVEKIRALAREVLNDWAAITAFVSNPALPATNNEAERALRDAVIARRISNGTRTQEGSAAYAATLSVFETCRRRGTEPWRYITDLLARARKGLPHLAIPIAA